jgi:hypothetical protein
LQLDNFDVSRVLEMSLQSAIVKKSSLE